MVRALQLAALAVAIAVPATSADAAPCAMSKEDAAWVGRALHAWDVVRAHDLHLAPAEPPTILTFDAACTYTATPKRPIRWTAAPYANTVKLPSGEDAPAGVMSFAAPYGASTRGFFVMSLPSVWRAGGVKSTLGLEVMMEAVLVHEIMHTRQFFFVNEHLAGLGKRYGLTDDIDDDSLQRHFEKNPAYVADYQAERDLLFAAAAAPDTATARTLAREALTMMRARKAKWFTGADEKWGALDDVFLAMEGLGQWAGYRWLIGDNGRRLDPGSTLIEFRRGGRSWTQDEGLALMLVVDRLYPGWQRAAFAAKPALAEELLARAVAG